MSENEIISKEKELVPLNNEIVLSKDKKKETILVNYTLFVVLFAFIILIAFVCFISSISYSLNLISYDINKIREKMTGDGKYPDIQIDNIKTKNIKFRF